MILIGLSTASDLPSQNTSPNATYLNHSLCFEIPNGWKVIKDAQVDNDTQIVLSDGANAIRVDLIKHPGIGKIIGDYLEYHVSKSELASFDYNPRDMSNESWQYAYARYPYYSNDAVCEYYKENVIKPVTHMSSSGSGNFIKPDGSEYAGVATNGDSRNDINEWIVAWTKPKYDSEVIGIHSLFKGKYPEIKVKWGSSERDYSLPEPLWIVLATINRGNTPLPKPTEASSLVELV